jgi:hypothetical protein
MPKSPVGKGSGNAVGRHDLNLKIDAGLYHFQTAALQ